MLCGLPPKLSLDNQNKELSTNSENLVFQLWVGQKHIETWFKSTTKSIKLFPLMY